MDRDIPNFNPIVVSRMQQKQLELHQQRLQNIKVPLLVVSPSTNRASRLPRATKAGKTKKQCSWNKTKKQKSNAPTLFSSTRCSKSWSEMTPATTLERGPTLPTRALRLNSTASKSRIEVFWSLGSHVWEDWEAEADYRQQETLWTEKKIRKHFTISRQILGPFPPKRPNPKLPLRSDKISQPAESKVRPLPLKTSKRRDINVETSAVWPDWA